MRATSVCLLALGLAACESTPDIPEGAGHGLLAVDREIPEGARTVERPLWAVGDTFRFRRGGLEEASFRVVNSSDAGYVLRDEVTQDSVLLDLDLGRRGEDRADDPERRTRMDPSDHEWAWPMFVGKRWSTHFLLKAPGRAVPVQADYHCDAWETITVPAGTFECIRVWRSARPAVDQEFVRLASVAWYAPEVGYFVRRLVDGVLVELQEFHRQR